MDGDWSLPDVILGHARRHDVSFIAALSILVHLTHLHCCELSHFDVHEAMLLERQLD